MSLPHVGSNEALRFNELKNVKINWKKYIDKHITQSTIGVSSGDSQLQARGDRL